MSASLPITALGAKVGIVYDDELGGSSRAAVEEAWHDARVDAADAGAVDIDVVVGPGGGIRHLLASLSQRVTLAAIEAQRGRMWMLHAAGLALPDGRVVALVGPSGRGKTTAARVLGEVFGYVSDETVAIDSHGRVHPYRKPLSLVEPGEPEKGQRSPSSLGLKELPDAALLLAAIVLLDRRDDVEGAVVSDVDLGDALEELVAQSSYLVDLPTPLRTIAAHVASVGGIRRVTYTDAATLMTLLPRLAAVPPITAPAVAAASSASARSSGAVAPARSSASSGPGAERRYDRVQPLDELGLDDPDRIAILHVGADGTGTARVLAGIAPALWRAADGAALDGLVEAAIAAYGAPERTDGHVIVAAAVDQLLAVGVLSESQAGAVCPRALWRVADGVAWTAEPTRVVVLAFDHPRAAPMALEGSAALVWNALTAGSGTTDVVVDRVAEAAGADGEAIRGDVESFLGTLLEHCLVSRD
ncbi:PqqD family peptide modification chaperone [Microbacterium ureisolvens]|uniref:PqqD family peptide modification chaperone n=1 Tax=Microbacterium ureisolvens TaxID=2781186 RepID=UPI0036272340